MKILFITSTRIGDAVLSTGLLNHIEQNYPDAKVTIACGPLVVSLFEGYPLLERLISIKKEKHHKHWFKLWKQVYGTRWDIVIDLRDSIVSRVVFARRRFIFTNAVDKSVHKAVQNASVMKLNDVPNPKLWFSKAQDERSKALIPDTPVPVVGVGPTANWIGKTWPVDRFIETVKSLIKKGGYFEGAQVAVFGAPGEEEDAYKLYNALPEDVRIDLIAKGSPGEAAACLARCDFYLGNDSGLMHCAAAAGVPTFGLFGASYPHIYAPYGAHAAYARTPETFDELIDFDGYSPQTLDRTLMSSLSVDMVKSGLDVFFQSLEKSRT